MEISKTARIIFFGGLVFAAVAERLWWDMGWNVELVTVEVLLSGIYLGRLWAVAFLVIVMGVSDLYLGNTNIWLFTWSAFLVEGIFGRRIFGGVGTAVGVGLWFYGWTNFGVWLLDGWGMYSNDLSGLMQSYINGLPFLKANLMSNLVIVPVGFGVVEGVKWLWEAGRVKWWLWGRRLYA